MIDLFLQRHRVVEIQPIPVRLPEVQPVVTASCVRHIVAIPNKIIATYTHAKRNVMKSENMNAKNTGWHVEHMQ